MIDVAVNDVSGLTVIHDDPGFDGALAFDVDLTNRNASILLRDGTTRGIGRLNPSMISILPSEGLARIVRMQRQKVARFDALLLRIHD